MDMKVEFVLGRKCEQLNCECKKYDKLIYDRDYREKSPPLHDGCDCYVKHIK